MDEPRIVRHPGFYVITGKTVEDVVLAADKSHLVDFDSIRSIEIVKEDEDIFTMVCLRKKT